MPDLLLYQTSDPAFADRALEALRAEGIPCNRTGTGYWDVSSAGRRDLGLDICIYIQHEADYQRANQIIIKLGAVLDGPPKLPSRRVIFLTVVLITMGFILVVLDLK